MENQLTPQAYGKKLYTQYAGAGIATRENFCLNDGDLNGIYDLTGLSELEEIADEFMREAVKTMKSAPDWYKGEYKMLGVCIATFQLLDSVYKKVDVTHDAFFQEKIKLYWRQPLRNAFHKLTGTKPTPEIDATIDTQLFNYVSLMALILQYRLIGQAYSVGGDEALHGRAKIAVLIRDLVERIRTELITDYQNLFHAGASPLLTLAPFAAVMDLIDEIASKFGSPAEAHCNELLDPVKTPHTYYYWRYSL